MAEGEALPAAQREEAVALALGKPEAGGGPGAPAALGKLLARARPGAPDTRAVLSAVRDVGLRQLQRLQELAIVQRFADRPLHEALPCFTVAIIMGTMYFSFVGMCMPAIGISKLGEASAAFHFSFLLSLTSYVQGVATDPGRIPAEWKGDPGGKPLFAMKGDGRFEPHERKKAGGFRYCHKEKVFKPDRAHYCSGLSRNVLRMDHYCPWLTTCVGYKNHKYFILFLLYTVAATDLANVHIIMALWHGHFPAMQTFMMTQGALLSSLISLTLTPFFGFHCWLISRNMTTLEYCEKRHLADGFLSPYDLGLLANFQCVMGEKPLLWLLPLGAPPGNGIDWEVRREGAEAAEAAAAPAPALAAGARGSAGRIMASTAEAIGELGGDLGAWGRSSWAQLARLARGRGARGAGAEGPGAEGPGAPAPGGAP